MDELTQPHPYEGIVKQALAATRDRRVDAGVRIAHSRLVCFALGRIPTATTEALIADALETAKCALDMRLVVHFIVFGVWQCVGEDARLATWVGRLASHALVQGQFASFALLLDLLVHAPGFTGEIRPEWVDGVAIARECPEARWDLFWFGYRMSELATARSAEEPSWVAALQADTRVTDAARDAILDQPCPTCPVCDWLDPVMFGGRGRRGRR